MDAAAFMKSSFTAWSSFLVTVANSPSRKYDLRSKDPTVFYDTCTVEVYRVIYWFKVDIIVFADGT